jgi:hypothetical protein
VRRRLALPAVVAAALLLSGCSPIVTLTPAPQATAVACAGVVVRLPGSIDITASGRTIALDKRETDAQGTAAWGEPARVTLRCGVTATPPSNQCVTFERVDWKVQSTRISGGQRYVLTTYGRTPAVQVVLDAGLPSDQVMPPISDAVQAAVPRQSVRCTVAGRATPSPGATSSRSGTATPSATPSPSATPTP